MAGPCGVIYGVRQTLRTQTGITQLVTRGGNPCLLLTDRPRGCGQKGEGSAPHPGQCAGSPG